MTATPFPGTDEFNRIWTRAYLHADEVVGTQHLLRGMVRVPQIAQLLDAYDVTPLVLRELVAHEAPEPGSVGRMLSVTVRPTEFSSAAAAALDRCQAQPGLEGGDERGPVDLLLAILGDSQSRAVAVLTDCEVDIEEFRTALREGEAPVREDRLPPDLRPTRDALIGRTRYRVQGRGLLTKLRNLVAGAPSLNYAAQPVFWVRLEADERARGNGRRMGTDDVLLALLTTFEVALAYPQLVRTVQHQYAGGQALVAAGLDHDRVRAVIATTDLGEDSVALPARLGDWPQDTTGIVQNLVCAEGSRSARVLTALGVSPAVLVPGHA